MAIKTLLAALTIPVMVCANLALSHERIDSVHIVDGIPARWGDIPFVVSIQVKKGLILCGGSLLDAYTVLTAAHCIDAVRSERFTVKDILVRAGSLKLSSGGLTSRVVSMITHPNHEDLQYDVGILKLADPIFFKDPVKYAVMTASDFDPVIGTNVTVAGWGYTEAGLPENLRMAHIPVISRQECNDQFLEKVTDDMFCAGLNKGDTCFGDSGGPLFDAETKLLIGVVSWGRAECGLGHAGVYARIGAMRKFIDEHLGRPDPQ